VIARSIKERLKAGEKVLAGWVYGLSPVTAEIMALAGYSALLIDQEHGPTELQMIHSQTVAAESRGAQVMVRPGDMGRDPTLGTLVHLAEDEIAIERQDERAGRVIVHFPRIGYELFPQ